MVVNCYVMFVQKSVFRVQRRRRQLDEKGNVKNVYAVDQFPAKEFNLGFNGLPANDLTLLARAQSRTEYELILSRLKEIQPNNAPVGLSDKEYLSRMVPNWVQWPSEIDRFMDYYNQLNPNTPLFEPVRDGDTNAVNESSVVDSSVEVSQ